MSTFTPPATSAVPPILLDEDPEATPLGQRLFRHYRARPQGINVFILSDNTVTEVAPDGFTVMWNSWDTNQDNVGAKYVKRAFYGGHDAYAITDAEGTLLTNAGYTITP